MTGPQLRSFVTRSRALVDSSPPTTESETRTWLVEPFLQALGWNVHSESCVTDIHVEETRLDYVLSVESVPALFVAVEAYDHSLEESRARDLLEAMAWSGVDRAIYTNGRDYFLLAGTTDVDRLACRLPSLTDHESSIAHYSRDTVGRRLERHSRPFVARQLALERASTVDSIVEQLTEITGGGDAYTGEFESAADRFLDRLVVSFASDDFDQFESGSEDIALQFTDSSATDSTGGSERIAGDDGENRVNRTASGTDTDSSRETKADAESGTDSGDGGTDPVGGDDTSESTGGSDTSESAGGDDAEGEYVVRFFNERGSIGAVGHSSSQQALVHAAEYLFERGLSGIRVPWSPDESDRTVLNDEPVRDDGTPMTDSKQLSNGYYLETDGTVAKHGDRVEALASRAGLRAMLTGDWETME